MTTAILKTGLNNESVRRVLRFYNSLRGQGLSHTQAANFAGVFGTEGGVGGRVYTGSFGYQSSEKGGVLNPGGAYGVGQWNESRQKDFLNFANSTGGNPASLDTQTAFAVQEANRRGINLNSTSDIVNRYEVPAQQYRAGEISAAYRKAATLTGTSGGGGPSNSGGSSGTDQPYDPSLIDSQFGGSNAPDAASYAYSGQQPGVGDTPDYATFQQMYGSNVSPLDASQDYGQDTGSGLPSSLDKISGGGSSAFGLDGPNPAGAGGDPSGAMGNLGPAAAGGGAFGLGGPNPSGAGGSGSVSGDSQAGAPVWLTDPNAVASKAGESVKTGAETLGKNVQSSEQDLNKGLTSDTTSLVTQSTALGDFFSNLTSGGSDLLPRIGVGLAALVLLGLGLWMAGESGVQRLKGA